MGPDVTQGTSGQRQPRPKGRCFGSAVLRRPCPPQPCSPEPRLARVSGRRKRGQQAVRTTSWPSENARDPGQTPYTRDIFAGRDVGRASSYPVSAGATSHPAPPPVSATEGERAPAGRRCLLVRFLPLKRVTVLRGTRRVQSASQRTHRPASPCPAATSTPVSAGAASPPSRAPPATSLSPTAPGASLACWFHSGGHTTAVPGMSPARTRPPEDKASRVPSTSNCSSTPGRVAGTR